MEIGAQEALEALRSGRVVAVPTEYSYALCAVANNADAVDEVLRLKGRRDPTPVIIGHPSQLNGLALDVSPVVFDLQQAFWPGPLTLIMEAVHGLPEGVLGPDRSIAVRQCGWAPLAELSRELDVAITATSANPAGRPPAFTPEALEKYFPGIDWYGMNPDPNPRPSTIADVRRGFPVVVRQGMIHL